MKTARLFYTLFVFALLAPASVYAQTTAWPYWTNPNAAITDFKTTSSSITVTAMGDDSTDLTFQIKYSTSPNFEVAITTYTNWFFEGPDSATVQPFPLEPNTSYYFVVRATDTFGLRSEPVWMWPPLLPTGDGVVCEAKRIWSLLLVLRP